MAAAIPVMVAEITKRAKSRGLPPAAEKEPEEAPESDYGAIKRSAVEDFVSALGLKNVDVEAATQALSDFHEACYGEEQGESPKDEAAEDEAA